MDSVTLQMARPKFFHIGTIVWAAIVMQGAVVIATTDNATVALEILTENPLQTGSWEWSLWSSWSSCSKSCGGGVSVQTRSCLARRTPPADNASSTEVSNALSPLLTRLQVSAAPAPRCQGPARRHHECHTEPCPGNGVSSTDTRREQCSAYDRRPFRGRYYHWVPYVDGDSPCTLNCRPLGHQFYASLSLAADGTPCTKPGSRAICIQGICKVVGSEGVLASSVHREARCGRRLVSGLFSRPRLPLGYSYVATVPRGACRLNLTEIHPSDNYIALKVSNGSYIMNGEFAVSAPGSYDAAGARFQYSRAANLDSVFAHGPILKPIDIMILYTQPNPSIKYEYFTESFTSDVETDAGVQNNLTPEPPSTIPPKHTRRHHSFRTHQRIPSDNSPRYPDLGTMSDEVVNDEEDLQDNFVTTRNFMWKISSFTECSRTCGGGMQIGKFRCVETSSSGVDREVSPIHCPGSAPANRRKRCGSGPCPPRWRAAGWSACPKCGPASRTRIVGCVQDHSKGITKVSDQKCPAPKPDNIEICNIPNCSDDTPEVIESKRVYRPREQVDNFRDGPIYTVSVNSSDDIGPEYSFSAAGGWLYTDWSECVGWCVGGGIRTRGVRCADPAGCAPRRSPDQTRACSPQVNCEPHDGQWFTGDWSPCSSQCGGKQIRGVLCIGGSGRHLRDSACKAPKPACERDCGDQCAPTWYFSDWSQCTGSCNQGTGQERRTVWCARSDDGVPSETECAQPKPPSERDCTLDCATDKGTALPGLTIESQRIARNEVTNILETTTIKESPSNDCKDILGNCALVFQARLCRYKYYAQNCCNSCRTR